MQKVQTQTSLKTLTQENEITNVCNYLTSLFETLNNEEISKISKLFAPEKISSIIVSSDAQNNWKLTLNLRDGSKLTIYNNSDGLTLFSDKPNIHLVYSKPNEIYIIKKS
ncbi:MAG: hypothetical protein NC918_00675 [Candidatus Omnitrophica bacterium]|nr:hypothetical protein [Candidatus Omnitrophota bacterium]